MQTMQADDAEQSAVTKAAETTSGPIQGVPLEAKGPGRRYIPGARAQ